MQNFSFEARIHTEIPINKLLQEGELFSWELWGYSLVVPLICLIGIGANTLSLMVFTFGDLKESIYMYLKALSVADLVTVILVLCSGISRGIGRKSFAWSFIDAFLHIPIASISTTISILALVTVTLERLIIIKFPVKSRPFFTSSKAKRNCWIIGAFSIIFNIPYYIIFTIEGKNIVYSSFGSTSYYKFHNWIRLILLGFTPAIILLMSNILLLFSLRRSRKRRISLLKPVSLEISDCTPSYNSERSNTVLFHRDNLKDTIKPSQNSKNNIDRIQHKRVTLVLIAMICSFIIGEFPTHIASRSSAVSLLFPSKPHLVDAKGFRIFKLVSTILMCCHYSCNFFLYCAFNKRFIKEFKKLWNNKIKPLFINEERTFTWFSETSNRSTAVSPKNGMTSRRKRKISSITQVSLKIGVSKKTYLETPSIEISPENVEMADKSSSPSFSV